MALLRLAMLFLRFASAAACRFTGIDQLVLKLRGYPLLSVQ